MKFSNDGNFLFLKTRYKDRYFDDQIKPEAHKLLGEALDVPMREGHQKIGTEETVAKPEAPPSSSLQQMHDEIIKNTSHSDAYNESDSAAAEINLYLSEPVISRSSDPLDFWERNKGRFPALAEVARVYLSAPSTSVDSERLFSTAAHILDEKRNRLSSQNAEKLIFIKKNLPYLIK